MRLQGQTDHNTKKEIEDSIRGVEYDFFYTGKRQAPKSPVIEIHVTSSITDWADQSYTRKAWYMGHQKTWKECIKNHIKTHLIDIGTEKLLVTRMMRDFEITKDKFINWDKYPPVHFRG